MSTCALNYNPRFVTQNEKPMHSLAPGKIILSGEHSIVYGSPALAVAVNRYAYASCKETQGNTITIEFDQFRLLKKTQFSYLVNDLFKILDQCDLAYEQYRFNTISIKHILKHPAELYVYAIGKLVRDYNLHNIPGLLIKLSTDIPISSGMGSSSATLTAVVHSVMCYLNLEFTKNYLLKIVSHAERLQHGCISSIDPVVSIHGGFVRVKNRMVERNIQVPNHNWYLVDTGIPEVSTGECVAEVRRKFGRSSIWQEFSMIIQGFEQALLCADTRVLKDYVRRNHQLLVDIGVVPKKVQQFIKELYKLYNGVGKISGAGAVAGEKAGFILVQSDHSILELCQRYRFQMHQLSPNFTGVRTA